MRKFIQLFFAYLLMLLLFSSSLFAQERTISGTILSEDNKTPLSGVTVRVKGTKRITQTNEKGFFTLKASSGETIQITHVGYKPIDFKVGTTNSIAISLQVSDNTMGEVVVTAMDIRRNSRELGYSAQSVGGKEIQQTQRDNFLNSLQGRVAGLTINPTSGLAGASSQIVLRGFNSLSLSNQPLFIVDGIILDNSTMNETSNGGTALGLASDRPNRNNDYTNRIADLNPSDIESVTVLKGPEATALYRSQASSGAIVITTKKATTGKLSLTYDNSFRIQKQVRYAPLNNDYSLGTSGVAGATIFTYWGPKYAPGTQTYDNIDHFFRTGFSQTHNLSADFGFKNTAFRLSGSYLNQEGVVPTNDYKKYNVRLTNTTKIGKWLEFTPSFQYINSTNDKAVRGAGGYLLDLYVWPVDNDIRNYMTPLGYKIPLNAADPYLQTDNPLYDVRANHSQDIQERYVLSGGLNITPTNWLTISGRFGYDVYNTKGYTYYNPLSYLTSRAQMGALDNYWRQYHGYNHTITATAKKNLGKFSGHVMAGTMWQDYKTEMFAIYGTNIADSLSSNGWLYKSGTIVTNLNSAQVLGNPYDSSITKPGSRIKLLRNYNGQYNISEIRQIAYFGEAGISYNNYLFLNYTQRFEAASVFTSTYRNYNYPGISFSAIVSDIFPELKKGKLSYWKIRSSLAHTARLPDPYSNQSVFVNSLVSSQVGPIFTYGFFNNNASLQPEKQRTYEVGTEARFFNGNLGVDADFYNTLCTNQINVGYRASYGTGFVLNTANFASTRNDGIEIVLDVSPIKHRDFSWNMRFNFNRTWSKVLALPPSIQQEYYIADTWLYGNARGGISINGTTTTITGFHYLKNNKGNVLVNPANGLPVVEGTFTVIGDRNPTFTLGTLNTLRYKNWSLNFLFDWKVGGDIYDATEQYLTYQGKSVKSANRNTPLVVKGVLNDGLQNTSNPTLNTIAIPVAYMQTYYQNMPEQEFIQHNVNWLRLRDLTLSYSLPPDKFKNIKSIKSLSFFATGNDLLLITNYKGADPSVNGNNASELGVGAFGFDYGTLGTPISLNFGIRAGF